MQILGVTVAVCVGHEILFLGTLYEGEIRGQGGGSALCSPLLKLKPILRPWPSNCNFWAYVATLSPSLSFFLCM